MDKAYQRFLEDLENFKNVVEGKQQAVQARKEAIAAAEQNKQNIFDTGKLMNEDEFVQERNRLNSEIAKWENMTVNEYDAIDDRFHTMTSDPFNPMSEEQKQAVLDEIKANYIASNKETLKNLEDRRKELSDAFNADMAQADKELSESRSTKAIKEFTEPINQAAEDLKQSIAIAIQKYQATIDEYKVDIERIDRKIKNLDPLSPQYSDKKDELLKEKSKIAFVLSKYILDLDKLNQINAKIDEIVANALKTNDKNYKLNLEELNTLDLANTTAEVMNIDVTDLADGMKNVIVEYKGLKFYLRLTPEQVSKENIMGIIQKSVLGKIGEADLAKISYNGHELTTGINDIDLTSVINGNDKKVSTSSVTQSDPKSNTQPSENTASQDDLDADKTTKDATNSNEKLVGNEYELNEQATMQNYSNSGYGQNAYGWYFDPSTDEYVEGYNPLNDPLFQCYDVYDVYDVLDEQATMQNYSNSGYGQNAYGWYFDPSTDEYVEGYNPLNDPLFQVFKQARKYNRTATKASLGNIDLNPIDSKGNGGPDNDGPENDGPDNDGPDNDGPGNDGPGNDGSGNDGPGNDGPGNNDQGLSDGAQPLATDDALVHIKNWRKCVVSPTGPIEGLITWGLAGLGAFNLVKTSIAISQAAGVAATATLPISIAALGAGAVIYHNRQEIVNKLKVVAENIQIRKTKRKIDKIVKKINKANAKDENFIPLKAQYDVDSNKVRVKVEGEQDNIAEWPEITDVEAEMYKDADGLTINELIDNEFNKDKSRRKLFDREAYLLAFDKYRHDIAEGIEAQKPNRNDFVHEVENRTVTLNSLENAFDIYGGLMTDAEREKVTTVEYPDYDSQVDLGTSAPAPIADTPVPVLVDQNSMAPGLSSPAAPANDDANLIAAADQDLAPANDDANLAAPADQDLAPTIDDANLTAPADQSPAPVTPETEAPVVVAPINEVPAVDNVPIFTFDNPNPGPKPTELNTDVVAMANQNGDTGHELQEEFFDAVENYFGYEAGTINEENIKSIIYDIPEESYTDFAETINNANPILTTVVEQFRGDKSIGVKYADEFGDPEESLEESSGAPRL